MDFTKAIDEMMRLQQEQGHAEIRRFYRTILAGLMMAKIYDPDEMMRYSASSAVILADALLAELERTEKEGA